MAARVGGMLVERNRCLFLRENGEDRLALWEEGNSYADEALLDSSGRVVMRVGEVLYGGGGYGEGWEWFEEAFGQQIPERCRLDGEPWVVVYDVQAGPGP
jgi:hypothetical protein